MPRLGRHDADQFQKPTKAAALSLSFLDELGRSRIDSRRYPTAHPK